MHSSPTDLLPELRELEELVEAMQPWACTEVLTEVDTSSGRYPVYGIRLGPEDRSLPTFALVGGVHGLERIGTQVVLAYLTVMARMLEWDELLHASLQRMRMVFVPLVNPGGMAMRRRSNPRGVDLMRNAPPLPRGSGTPFVGGQTLSPRLPWFAGRRDGVMEPEASALCAYVEREVVSARASILLDVHSGFGLLDRLWFPHAHTRRPCTHLAEVLRLAELLDRTLPHHIYRIEPQAQYYTIQGDLWDYVYDRHCRAAAGGTFLPMTLEMGSWLWLKKNPRQIFDVLGTFNPMKPHRVRRTLRRHLPLLDFLRRACGAPAAWCEVDHATRAALEARAFERWYSE